MNDKFIKLIIVFYIHLEGEEILFEEPSVVLILEYRPFFLMYFVALFFGPIKLFQCL